MSRSACCCRPDWSPSRAATRSRCSTWPRSTPACRAWCRGDWQEYLARHGVGKDRPVHRFAYSNFGFGLLGQVLADRAGLTYSELLREQVTGPLGLNDTVVIVSPEQQGRFMQGYDAEHHPVPVGRGRAGRLRGDSLHGRRHAEVPGSQSASGNDSAARCRRRWRCRTSRARRGLPGTRIALAWFHNAADGTWSHGGAMRGFTSYAFFNPKDDYAAVVLLNTGPNAVGLADLMSEHIRQRLAGEPAVSLDAVFVPASSGFPGLLRWFAAYWFTMLASGVFIYCGVLGVQGTGGATAAAPAVPARLGVSATGGLLPVRVRLLSAAGVRRAGQPHGAGDSTPAALGAFVLVPGALPPIERIDASRRWRRWRGARGSGWRLRCAERPWRMRFPICARCAGSWRSRISRPARAGPAGCRHSASRVQTAIGQFSVRTLVRSRQHRVILAFYLGIGFAFTIFLLKAPAIQEETANARDGRRQLLAASIVMMVLAMVGTRVVFALPLDLRANWIFRVTPVAPAKECTAASRRALLLLSAAPVWLGSAVLCLRLWPWRQAAGHLALLGLLGMLLADLALRGFRKLPFTCSYLPGKSQVHMVFLGAAGLMWLVMLGVKLERQALQDSRGIAAMLVLFGAAAVCARWAREDEEALRFEEEATPAVLELGLHRDGATPLGPASG